MNIEAINNKFQRALKMRSISSWLIIISAVMLVISKYSKSLWFFIISLLAVISGIVINLVYWRCPACGKVLPGREPARNIQHCLHCGTKLRF